MLSQVISLLSYSTLIACGCIPVLLRCLYVLSVYVWTVQCLLSVNVLFIIFLPPVLSDVMTVNQCRERVTVLTGQKLQCEGVRSLKENTVKQKS